MHVNIHIQYIQIQQFGKKMREERLKVDICTNIMSPFSRPPQKKKHKNIKLNIWQFCLSFTLIDSDNNECKLYYKRN